MRAYWSWSALFQPLLLKAFSLPGYPGRKGLELSTMTRCFASICNRHRKRVDKSVIGGSQILISVYMYRPCRQCAFHRPYTMFLAIRNCRPTNSQSGTPASGTLFFFKRLFHARPALHPKPADPAPSPLRPAAPGDRASTGTGICGCSPGRSAGCRTIACARHGACGLRPAPVKSAPFGQHHQKPSRLARRCRLG